MFIPGWLFNALTFPGVIFHECSVLSVCKVLKLKATLNFFDFLYGGAVEIVQVNDSDLLKHSVALRYIPILFCSLACMGAAYFNQYTPKESFIEFIVVWISFSLGVHGFPLKHAMGSWAMSLIGLEIIYSVTLFFIAK